MKTLLVVVAAVLAAAARWQSLSLFNIDATNFPTMKAKFYAFDAAGKMSLTESIISRIITNTSLTQPTIAKIASSPCVDNLLTNGSFTSVKGAVVTAPGWTATSTPDVNDENGALHTTSGYVWTGKPIASSDGGTWQNLFDTTESISQTITVVQGAEYTVCFEYAAQGIITFGLAYKDPVGVKVLINGEFVFSSPDDTTQFTWERTCFSYRAKSPALTVKMLPTQEQYVGIDGVCLMPIDTLSNDTTQVVLACATIDFGEIEIGNSKDSIWAATVRNVGTKDIAVSNVGLNGANHADFSILSGGGSFTLRGGDTARLDLRFTPSAIGSRSAVLLFECSGTGAPVGVPLNGEGVRSADSATLVAGTVNAFPGEQTHIPITLILPQNSTLSNVTGFDVTLRYNPTLLFPADNSMTATTSGSDALLTFFAPYNPAGRELLAVPFIATLGDDTATAVKIEKAAARVAIGTVNVATRDGARLRYRAYAMPEARRGYTSRRAG